MFSGRPALPTSRRRNVPGNASLVRYYERLVHILTSPSSRDILYLKLIPRFLTETRLVICTGAGMSPGQMALRYRGITC